MLTSTDIKRHQRYHERLIGILPSKFEAEDPNKISLLYFALCSLSLLGDLPLADDERSQLKTIIYDQMVVTDQYCAFAPSRSLWPHGITLSATCFALQSLLILGDDLHNIKLNKMKQFVLACQQENGGFTNCPIEKDNVDLRFSMLAATILKFIKCDGINVSKLTNFVNLTQSYDGGFASDEGGESHAGLTFCAVDSLSLISQLHQNQEDILVFLTHRQIHHCRQELKFNEYADIEDQGGFNGRWNKYGDTCYVFWCIASLSLLNHSNLIDKDLAIDFLLNKTQNKVMGGFNKTSDPDDYPDPLHSFLGLAALSLLNVDILKPFDPQLVIPLHTRKHWETLNLLT